MRIKFDSYQDYLTFIDNSLCLRDFYSEGVLLDFDYNKQPLHRFNLLIKDREIFVDLNSESI